MSAEANQDVFDDMVRQTIKRRLERLTTEELLDTLGFLILKERQKSAGGDKPPAQVIA